MDEHRNNDDHNHVTTTIRNKVILVTGANRGIGAAFVHALLEQGARKVYAAVRNLESIKENDKRVIPLFLDLGNPTSIAEAATASQDVDIVINNAGILSRTAPLDGEHVIGQLEKEMQVNVHGLIYMAQSYIPILQKNNDGGSGSIFCQINSVASFRCGGADVATYSASKAASYSITQALRQQLREQDDEKTRILSVHPGPIATEMLRTTASPEVFQSAATPETVVQQVMQAINDQSPSPPFHVFPDAKAQQLEVLLKPYTTEVIENGKSYG